MQKKEVVEYLLKELSRWGAYLYYEASTGSNYIKFPHWALGSIRIADHGGIPKYKYRWNVMLNRPNESRRMKHGKVVRWYFGSNHLSTLIIQFEEEASQRKVNPGESERYEDREKPIV